MAKGQAYSKDGVKQANLQSAFDTHNYGAYQTEKTPDDYAMKQATNIPARSTTQSAKMASLASNIGGHDATKYYNQEMPKGEVVDIDISGLPENCDDATVKRAANVKHFISSELQYDNFTGKCKGEGRLKVRLNAGETMEQIRINLLRAGISVKNHIEDARKKPAFTGPPKEENKFGGMNANERKHFANQTKMLA